MSTATQKLTLRHLDVSKIKRLVVVRKNGGTRTMKLTADISKFVREHHSDAIERYEDGRMCSVQSGSDYRSLLINLV